MQKKKHETTASGSRFKCWSRDDGGDQLDGALTCCVIFDRILCSVSIYFSTVFNFQIALRTFWLAGTVFSPRCRWKTHFS